MRVHARWPVRVAVEPTGAGWAPIPQSDKTMSKGKVNDAGRAQLGCTRFENPTGEEIDARVARRGAAGVRQREEFMRRLCRSVTGMALLAVAAWGCGSNAGDPLTLRFVRFDNANLTQSDAVRENSADVDVVPGACVAGTTVTAEPFTQTIINAVFVNEEGADIHLQRYRVYLPQTINGRPTGLPAFVEQAVGVNIPGGLCQNIQRGCASDSDCGLAGVAGVCVHSETTVSALVLFDFTTKTQLDRPEITLVPMATDIAVQFFGTDDADQSFDVSAGYVATFGNFNSCPSGSIEVDG